MKIACVFMPWHKRNAPSPEFASMIAQVKRMGHRVIAFDINNEMFLHRFNKRSYWKYLALDAPDEVEEAFYAESEDILKEYCHEIMSHIPDIILFKPIANTYNNAINFARILKKESNGKPIIFSGKYTTGKEDLERTIEQQADYPFDFVICGQDEVALPKLLEAIEKKDMSDFEVSFKRNGKVINCIDGPVLQNLDGLPFFDFSDLNLNTYKHPQRLEIFTSRGCPWRCSFCVSCMVEGRFRSMSGKRIIHEILYQLNFHNGINYLQFCDNTINGDIGVLSDFCDLILNEHRKGLPKIQWSGDAMIRLEMTAEMLLKMNAAGCNGLGYGIESGCQHVIRDMSKPFSVELAERVIRDTHRASIKTSINIMTGFPTESRSDFNETLEFIERNRKNIDEIRLTYNGCRICEDSYLYKNHERFGITSLDPERWVSNGGENTHDERTRRTQDVCNLALSLGIEIKFNGRAVRKETVNPVSKDR